MDLGLPTGTIAFWGSHVLWILTVDYTFKPYNAEIFCINHGDQKAFFQFEIIMS